jgi:cytochrome P450
VSALAGARALTWGWPAASRELDRWKERAGKIPNARLREDALRSISLKRDNAQGAALFCILPKRREPALLELLVAYQTLWDFLDNVNERGAVAGKENGYQLHRALFEALDPDISISDYYSHHPWGDDGGYVRELVETCRNCCLVLPSYPQVQPRILEGVRQCSIQGINHLSDSREREEELKTWAEQQWPAQNQFEWFELTAAASAFLPHALLALAAEPACDTAYAAKAHDAYFPWMALAITMLDSYVDAVEDRANDNHSYIAHYADQGAICKRLSEILTSTVSGMAQLPNGHRHVLMATSMIAMYLSTDAKGWSRTPAMTKQLATAAGSFTRLLVPAACLWRTFDARRATAMSRKTPRRAAKRSLPRQIPIPALVQTFLFWSSPFHYLQYCRRQYGQCFTLRATSHPPLIFLSEPQEIRALMTTSEDVLRPGEGGATVSPIVGERSFMLSDGEEHRVGRKTVVSAFHARAVEQHADMVADAAERVLGNWPTDTAVALHPRLRSLTLEVILRTITGRFTGPLDDRLRLLHDRVLEMLSVTASPVFVEPRLRYGPGRRIWQNFLSCRTQVDELLAELIDERSQDEAPSGDVLGLLTMLPNPDGSPISRSQVRDNAMSLILAGHETTAAQLSWAFQLLAHNQDVCDRLIQEIDAGASDEYLTATVQEVLRHRCVFVFAIPRAVATPVDIGGRTYHPPTQLLACIYLLHHDPSIYPDPHTFRPERFLDAPPDPRTWIPWGGGRKRCPGLHLAMLEMKTVLRTVLAERTVHPASSHIERPRWRSVIVTPHAGSRVILRTRDRSGKARPVTDMYRGPPDGLSGTFERAADLRER